MSSNVLKGVFSEQISTVNHVVNRCSAIQALLLRYRGTDRVGLAKFFRARGYLEWYRNINLHLKPPAALAPERVSFSF